MKIAMVVNSYPPRVGGLEYHIENLAQGLSDLGHEVWVLTISSTPGRRIDGEVRVLTGRAHLPIADVITLPSLGTTQALTRFLVQHGIDLVSTLYTFFPDELRGPSGRTPRWDSRHPYRTRQRLRCQLLSRHLRGLACCRPHDGPLRAHACRQGARGLRAGCAVRRKAWCPCGRGLLQRDYSAPAHAPLPDRPTHLVFVGRVVAGKGWDTFLEAVRRLRERGTEVTGEILGDGAERERAVAYAQELGVSEVVAVRGRVSQEQVRQALRGSTLVNPTVLSEGFQTTLLEAIAERGRVVTFDVPGAYLLRKQGAPVTICESKDAAGLSQALIEMLSAPPGPADPSFITQWTWPVRAAQYATIAEQVIAAQVR